MHGYPGAPGAAGQAYSGYQYGAPAAPQFAPNSIESILAGLGGLGPGFGPNAGMGPDGQFDNELAMRQMLANLQQRRAEQAGMK